MVLRKIGFGVYFIIIMVDVCLFLCNSRYVDNYVYVLILGCYFILFKIKVELMYYGVLFFIIYKNKNFI